MMYVLVVQERNTNNVTELILNMTNDQNKKSPDDLTAIEDLSEYVHEEDRSLNRRFHELEGSEEFISDQTQQDLANNSQLQASETSETETASAIEILEEEISSIQDDNILNEAVEINYEISNAPLEDDSNSLQTDEVFEDLPQIKSEDLLKAAMDKENFDSLRNFTHNFSSSPLPQSANPPYSLLLKNMKNMEDVNNVIDLLIEYHLIDSDDRHKTEIAMSGGTYLLSQLSEYTAIILAHHFRSLNLDLEFGLSDKIFVSKAAGPNPRGRISKHGLTQNKTSEFKAPALNHSPQDIIASTHGEISGFVIESYLGVETSFAVISLEELKRLNFVQTQERENLTLEDLDLDFEEISSLKNEATTNSEKTKLAFKNYANNFMAIYDNLLDQLKNRAITKNANALLGVQYNLTQIKEEDVYHITCSATLTRAKKLTDQDNILGVAPERVEDKS